ncbi:MAG: hypothetical protein JKY19_05120, partial [Alcanivoracaceae bacterium]|nr:hypothetical protein [Alcanivoracaceae bacterium]
NERICKESVYRHGNTSRPATTMCKIASELSEDDIAALSEHYEDLSFVGVKQDFDSILVKKGVAIHKRHCEKCHSEGGSIADDDAGLLAGQWTPYLRLAIENLLAEKRPMADKMSVKMKLLDDEDFEALLSFYASKAQ